MLTLVAATCMMAGLAAAQLESMRATIPGSLHQCEETNIFFFDTSNSRPLTVLFLPSASIPDSARSGTVQLSEAASYSPLQVIQGITTLDAAEYDFTLQIEQGMEFEVFGFLDDGQGKALGLTRTVTTPLPSASSCLNNVQTIVSGVQAAATPTPSSSSTSSRSTRSIRSSASSMPTSGSNSASSRYIQQNVTADDFDARISYSNDTFFTTPNPSDASTRQQYSEYLGGTYHATSTANASISYSFQGTSIYVYSAQGPNFGSVAIDLDGNSTTVSAYASNNLTVNSGLLNYLLFSASGLEMGAQHNLTMRNLGAVNAGEGDEMLLDYIIATVQLAPSGATLTNHTIEDTNLTALNYTGQWGQNSNSLFSGGTTHYTNDSTAAVSFSFYGTAMYIYGDQNNDHGAFEVELDGESEVLRTPLGCGGVFRSGYCEKTDPGAQYFKAYLGPELHNVTIRNVNLNQSLRYSPTGNAPTFTSYFDLDRIVYTTPSEYLAIDASGSNGNSANGIGAAAAGNNGGTGAAPLSAGTSGFCLAGTAALAVLLLYAIGL